MTTQDTIKEIKLELRSVMNGVASAQMRGAGMPYKLIFGVELPRLQELARQYRPDRRLAQALWNEAARECKILALLLMPPAECPAEVADIWVEEMPTAELAQVGSLCLFSDLRDAADTAFRWIASGHPMRELCGYLTLARLLQRGAVLSEVSERELRDQAAAALPDASLPLRKAIAAVLGRLPGEEETDGTPE